jgi:hypothetical protein
MQWVVSTAGYQGIKTRWLGVQFRETVTEEAKAAVDGGSRWRQRTGGDQESTTTPEASGYATRVEMDKVASTGLVGT